MDYKKREEIFSKEALHISDVAALIGCSYDKAAVLIREWKRKIQFSGKELRLNLDGKIHILDYFDVMGINGEDPGERYFRRKPKEKSAGERYLEERAAPSTRKSVCLSENEDKK